MQGMHQRTHPHGEEYIFAHIALAAYKLVIKTESNTNSSDSPTQISTKNLIYK